MCLFLVCLHRWLGLAHALCSVQAFHILFHILLHVMSVDFASVKVVIKESYYYYYYYLDPSSRLATWAENSGAAPFGRGAGSPSNTESPGLRPTFIPSGILMHPAVSPQ